MYTIKMYRNKYNTTYKDWDWGNPKIETTLSLIDVFLGKYPTIWVFIVARTLKKHLFTQISCCPHSVHLSYPSCWSSPSFDCLHPLIYLISMSRVEKPTGAMGYTFDATAHGTLASALSLGMGKPTICLSWKMRIMRDIRIGIMA